MIEQMKFVVIEKNSKRPDKKKSPHGVHSAIQIDPNIIIKHGYNVAVAPGEKFIVIDVDPRNGGDITINALQALHGDLPHTWRVTTPNGGYHLYYKVDRPTRGTSMGGVDIIGLNKYALFPPSRIITKEVQGAYEFEIGHSPDDIEMADLPSWVREEFELDVPTPQKTIANDDVFDEDEYHRARFAINMISADCDYHTWIKLGMALKSEFNDAGFEIWNDWSKTAPEKYPGIKQLEKHWKSFSVDGGITIASLYDEVYNTRNARRSVEEIEHEFFKDEEIEVFNHEDDQIAQEEEIEIKNEKYPEPSGLLKAVRDWVLREAYIKHEGFALASAINVLGTICQRTVYAPTGIHTSFYSLICAPSASGKNDYLILPKYLLQQVNHKFVAKEMRSELGVKRELEEYPSRCWYQDEWVAAFQRAYRYRSDVVQEALQNIFLTLWGKVPLLDGTATKKKDEGLKSVVHPRLSILGTGTLTGLKQAMQNDEFVSSGFLSRLDVYFGSDVISDGYRVGVNKMHAPDWLVEALRRIFASLENFIGAPDSPSRTLTFAEGVHEYMNEQVKEFERIRTSSGYDVHDPHGPSSLWKRAADKNMRLATIHAVSCERDYITKDDADFSFALILRNTRELINHLFGNVDDVSSAIIEFLRQRKNGATIYEMTRGKRVLRNSMLRKQALNDLVESGVVEVSRSGRKCIYRLRGS